MFPHTLSRRLLLKNIAAILLLGCALAGPLRAEHDHDHIYVTIVDYLGYQRSSEHYVIKVKRSVDGEAYYYFLHFTDDAVRYLKGHDGERLQISLSSDGRSWLRAWLPDHPVIKIRDVESVAR